MNSYTFVISTGDTDRHLTRLDPQGWELENYRRNPIVFYQEPNSLLQPDPDQVIGKSVVWLKDGKLMAELTWDEGNQMASRIRKKVDNGSLRGASVLFNPLEPPVERGNILCFSRMDLLAWKVVNIPSNPKCLLVDKTSERARRLRQLESKLNGPLT